MGLQATPRGHFPQAARVEACSLGVTLRDQGNVAGCELGYIRQAWQRRLALCGCNKAPELRGWVEKEV